MRTIKIILRNFPVSLTRVPLMLVFIFIDIFSLPFKAIEYLLYAGKIKTQTIDPNPVFIIGHWRSGTTFLHQLLSSDKQFGFINFYSAMFPNSFLWTEKIIKPLLNKLFKIFGCKIPFFNNIKYDFDFPCEEDTALLNMGSPSSAYWAYAFPQKAMAMFSRTMYFDILTPPEEKDFIHDYLYLLRKIGFKHRNKRLLLKSPPNTARIKLLLETFPDAKFIYIRRDPIELYYSHQKLWKQCLKNYALQKISLSDLDTIIIQTMKKITEQYNEDKKALSKSNLCEIDYEALRKNPLSVIKEIYESLGLSGFMEAENNFRAQIEKTKKYKTFKYEYSKEKINWIETSLNTW